MRHLLPIAIGDQAILTAQTAATVAEATAALSRVNVAAGQVTARDAVGASRPLAYRS